MASSKLVTHTYVTDGASKPILSASSDKVLDINLKVSHIADSDPTIGGVWKFSEHFVVNEMTIQGEITKKDYADQTIVFDSYVSDLAINFAKAIHPGMDDAALEHYQELFGSTKIHLWYNKSYPLINVIIYNPNEIDSSLVKPEDKDLVERVFNVGRLGYPSLIFTGDTTATKSFNFTDLTSDSKAKLAALGCSDADETFVGEWYDEYYNEVSVTSWYKEVVTWVENHNRSLIDEKRKNDPEWMMTVDDAFRLYDHLSSLHVLTKGKIEKVEDLFFKVGATDGAFYLEAVGGSASVTLNRVFKTTPYNLLTSTDGEIYDTEYNGEAVEIPEGGKLYFKAKTFTGTFSTGSLDFFSFAINNGQVRAGGNLNYLIDPVGEITELPDYTFYRLFYNCKGLISAPGLPATTLGSYCYSEMFKGCTSLKSAPSLPAETIGTYCYAMMFDGCTSLVNVPSSLPVMDVPGHAYEQMFRKSGIVNAPSLPATTVGASSYTSMFSNCKSLVHGPASLPAISVTGSSYSQMFYECSAMTTGPAFIAATSSGYATFKEMFYNCSSLVNGPSFTLEVVGEACCYSMFDRCTAMTTCVVSLPATELKNSCYKSMFSGCKNLTTIVDTLPALELTNGCYSEMFYKCEKMTKAPELLATTLTPACYKGMFSGCVSLTEGPSSLPATTLTEECYKEMFKDTPIAAAPELPATVMTADCYYGMFSGCKELLEAPELPATTLAEKCYSYMFSGCKKLTNVPSLPATQLKPYCYKSMFSGCDSIEDASAISFNGWLDNSCMESMFYGCKSLKVAPSLTVKNMYKTSSAMYSMFMDCQALVDASNINITFSDTGSYTCWDMFMRCKALTDKVPTFSGNVIGSSDCVNMFYDCTSLTKAPDLPFTSLKAKCYDDTFANCANLTEIKMTGITRANYEAAKTSPGCGDIGRDDVVKCSDEP